MATPKTPQPKRPDPRPVLVTGGAGFIGSHTVEALLAAGHCVRVLDNFSGGRAESLPEGHPQLDIMDGDVTRVADVQAAVRGCRQAIHLAAGSAEEPSPAALAQVNIVGFLTLREAAVAAQLERVVYASSAAVYGRACERPCAESAPKVPCSPRGLEALVCEQYAAMLGAQTRTRFAALRYFNVYGPRQATRGPRAGVIGRWLERQQQGRAPLLHGDGEQSRDFIYVKDAARATLAALYSPYQGAINVCTGRSTTLQELADLFGRISGAASAQYAPERDGDIRHVAGHNDRLKEVLQTPPVWSLEDGLTAMAPRALAA